MALDNINHGSLPRHRRFLSPKPTKRVQLALYMIARAPLTTIGQEAKCKLAPPINRMWPKSPNDGESWHGYPYSMPLSIMLNSLTLKRFYRPVHRACLSCDLRVESLVDIERRLKSHVFRIRHTRTQDERIFEVGDDYGNGSETFSGQIALIEVGPIMGRNRGILSWAVNTTHGVGIFPLEIDQFTGMLAKKPEWQISGILKGGLVKKEELNTKTMETSESNQIWG